MAVCRGGEKGRWPIPSRIKSCYRGPLRVRTRALYVRTRDEAGKPFSSASLIVRNGPSTLNFTAMSLCGYKLMIHSMSTWRKVCSCARIPHSLHWLHTTDDGSWRYLSVTKAGIISLRQKLRFPRRRTRGRRGAPRETLPGRTEKTKRIAILSSPRGGISEARWTNGV